jgi:hypothetical protein
MKMRILMTPIFFGLAYSQIMASAGTVRPESVGELRVSKPEPDLLHFEVCSEKGCQPLGNSTGLFRLQDLQAYQARFEEPRRRWLTQFFSGVALTGFVVTLPAVFFGIEGVQSVHIFHQTLELSPNLYHAPFDMFMGGAFATKLVAPLREGELAFAKKIPQLADDAPIAEMPMSEFQKLITRLDNALKDVQKLSDRCARKLAKN